MTSLKSQRKKVAIVLPVYNEQGCIKKVLTEWQEGLRFGSYDYEFIIVNDGSYDQTPIILDQISKEWKNLIIFHTPNQGHGQAIRFGYQEAIKRNPDYIFQTDSDDQFSPQDFLEFWKQRDESPLLLGIRLHRQDSFHRKIISYFLKTLIFDYFDLEIQDANIPYRLFKTEYLKELLAATPYNVFAPNIFISILGIAHLKTVPQIPITHRTRKTGQVSLISWGLIKACLRCFKELFAFRYNLYEKIHFLENGAEYKALSQEDTNDQTKPSSAA